MSEKLKAFKAGIFACLFFVNSSISELIWTRHLSFDYCDLHSEMIHSSVKGYLVLDLLSGNLTFLLPENIVKNEEIIF